MFDLMFDLTEAQKGLRDIRDWLRANPSSYIDWKLNVCRQNYPVDKPYYQPYYDAMIRELEEVRRTNPVTQGSPMDGPLKGL